MIVPWWGADAAAIALALVASGFELRTGTIPNALAACGLLAGALAAAQDGAWLSHLAGLFLAFVPGLVLWKRAAVGGGTVKLFGAIGLLVGAAFVGWAWLACVVVAGVAWLVPRWRGKWVPGAPVLLFALVVATAAHALTRRG